jgi:hypothetical protein
MAKQEVIQNLFDGIPAIQSDKLDKKYLQYVQQFQGSAAEDALNAFRTRDLDQIESALKNLSVSRTTASYLIGIGALIIEREKLYRKAGYRSYIEYARHLLEDIDIPVSTLSDDKIIMERWIDYYEPLTAAGFKLEGNASKLRYLEIALQNHDGEDVFKRISRDSARTFIAWAQRKTLAEHKPGPETRVDAKTEGGKLFIDGKNILNFPKNLPESVRDMVKADLEKTFSIREGGNEPFIIGTYGRGEQAAIENFLKQYRAKR